MTVLHSNVSVLLRVDDPDTQQRWVFPVISVSMTWAINEIPICNLEIGIGRAINRDADDQQVESASSVLTPRRICRVLASFRGDFATDKPWPEDITTIFRGNCVGVSNSLTRGRATLSVTLHHWLQHLQFSTVLGGYAVPGDPESKDILAAAFGFGNSGEEAFVDGRPLASLSQLADARMLFDNNFYADLWGVGIKPLIDHLISAPLTTQRIALTCEDLINAPSPEAIEAWRSIEVAGEENAKWAVPLSLTAIGDDSIQLSAPVLESISQAITHAPIDYARQTDVWSQLVMRYCADFGAMLVPRVESAIVAPRVDSLRSHYCYEIDANSIYQIDAFEPRQLPLAYIGVIASYESASGMDSFGDPGGGGVRDLNNFVGCYPTSTDADKDNPQRLRSTSGLTQFINRPAWLVNAAVALNDARADFKDRSVRGGVGAVGGVDGEQTRSRDTESRQAAAEASVQVEQLLQRYAKMRYNQMILRGRGAKIIGKLRFDIAPGSSVAINVKPSDIRGLQIDAPRLYGLVSRLTIVIDVSRKLAATVFQIANLRTESENASPDYASDNHPLYGSVFHGAPLLDEYAIGPQVEGNECPS